MTGVYKPTSDQVLLPGGFVLDFLAHDGTLTVSAWRAKGNTCPPSSSLARGADSRKGLRYYLDAGDPFVFFCLYFLFP